MYVYRTPEFDAEVERQVLSDHVNRLCDELERMQLDEVQARFERIYPYLKRKEKNNLRLIARIYRIGNDYVLCWLKVFRRGDSGYIHFVHDRELNVEINEEELKQSIRAQKATAEKQQPLQALPQTLRPWLQRPNLKMTDTGALVYESQVWLNQCHSPEIKAEWAVYNQLILQVADASESLGDQTSYAGVKLYGNGSQFILYRHISAVDSTQCSILFLIAPFSHCPTGIEIANAIETINVTPDFFEDPIDFESLSALAARAYPDYLVADSQLWWAIENEEAANLALSAEEEQILHAVSTKDPSLPLFLNGQAGSGKSTMLFYLFADYCQRHLSLCEEEGRSLTQPPHPLFLAYNERLLNVAKERVQCLLKSHYRFL
ncbi:MAG: hypothetical protein ACOC0N_12750, partial [Chroococcales cyanobacterium]